MENANSKQIAIDLGLGDQQVEKVIELTGEGNTIPFIARYRKEVTGALDEEQIREINEVYLYQVNLLKRKEDETSHFIVVRAYEWYGAKVD